MTNNQTNTNSVPEGYLEKNQQQNFTQKSEKKNFFQTKRFKTILASMLIILSFGIIGVTALETVGPEEYRISNAFGLNSGTQDEDNNENEINSFEECVEAEGVILESFPEQCEIDNQTFTRELTDEEKAMLEEQNNQTSVQPLVADDNYDVVVIEECDLAIKYDKTIALISRHFDTRQSGMEESFDISCADLSDETMILEQAVAVNGQSQGLADMEQVTIFSENMKDLIGEVYTADIFLRSFPEDNYPDMKTLGFDYGNKRYFVKYYHADPEMVNLIDIADNELIELQFDSLAPSVASMTIEKEIRVYTNTVYPDFRFAYPVDWIVEEDFTSQQPGADTIIVTNGSESATFTFLRGIGSMADYRCYQASSIIEMGNLLAYDLSGFTYIVSRKDYAINTDQNFEASKALVTQKMTEEQQTMGSANSNRPLPTVNDNVCSIGWDGLFKTQDSSQFAISLNGDEPVAFFEISVSEITPEVQAILSSVQY
jgi:hypothetical protein